MAEHVTIGVETVSGGIDVDGILSVRAPRQSVANKPSVELSNRSTATPLIQPGFRLSRGPSDGFRARIAGVKGI